MKKMKKTKGINYENLEEVLFPLLFCYTTITTLILYAESSQDLEPVVSFTLFILYCILVIPLHLICFYHKEKNKPKISTTNILDEDLTKDD